MHRVLSFQMGMSGRGFGESSEFVTKRMCFSFIFFFGFLSLIGGFLLGRMSTEKTLKLCEDRNIKCVESTNAVLEAAGPSQLQYNLLLEELRNSSFDQFHFTKTSGEYRNEDDLRTDREAVKTILSNSSLFYKVVQRQSSVAATLIGSLERDRWVVLSVSGDGTRLALELMRIFGKLIVDHNWKPHRTIIFCFYDEPHDSCYDSLPKYSKSRIVAYLTIHGNAVQKRGCLHVSGSDIIKSVVLGNVQESITLASSNDEQIFESCKMGDDLKDKILVPRLLADVPHASISIITSNDTRTEFNSEREMLPSARILVRIIGLSLWKLSESAVLRWDSRNFEQNVKTALSMISSPQLGEVREKITSAMEKLINKVQGLSTTSNEIHNLSSLSSRMTNDLLTDLDKALLCPDVNLRSKTDLVSIPKLLSESQEAISSFLENLLKCYNDAVEVIQEG